VAVEIKRREIDFGFDPDPGMPGWHIWGPRENGHFNRLYDPVQVLPEAAGRARVRVVPGEHLTSANGTIHGGALMGFIDIALFAGARGCGVEQSGWAVTLDCTTQFIGAAVHGEPLEAVVELLRETGRLLFLRGTVEQRGAVMASFNATVRKSSTRA
jgi:acyl-coenzyme A thioesterase PaaI-like protein